MQRKLSLQQMNRLAAPAHRHITSGPSCPPKSSTSEVLPPIVFKCSCVREEAKYSKPSIRSQVFESTKASSVSSLPSLLLKSRLLAEGEERGGGRGRYQAYYNELMPLMSVCISDERLHSNIVLVLIFGHSSI